MSIEFKRSGAGVVKDHNELANKGTKTHAEIDLYMQELDDARGTNPSIGGRFEGIEAEQSAHDTELDGLATRITAVEAEVVDARIDKAGIEYPNLKDRLDATQGVGGGGGGGLVLSQVTKLNVTASSSAPHVVEITIPGTLDFAVPNPDLLKFRPGTQDIVSTQCAFDNSDATSFAADSFVIFDGTMRLKTQHTIPSVDGGRLGSGRQYSVSFDKADFKSIEKLEVVI